MNLAALALCVALVGGRILPPESIVPAGKTAAAAYYEQLGQALVSWSAYEAAVRNFQKGLEQDDTRTSLRLGLAQALIAAGLGEQALEQVNLVLKKEPTSYPANRLYAEVVLRGGKPVEAELVARHLVTREPDDPLAWRLLGLSRFARRQLTPAEQAFRTAVKLRPLEPEPHKLLAQVLLAAKRPAAAMTALVQYLDLRPDDVESTLILAELYVTHGLNAAAVELGLKLVKRYPDNPKLLMGLATTLVKLNRRELAAQFFVKALGVSKDPRVVLPAADFLSKYHASRGQYAAAAGDLARIVALQPALLPPRVGQVQFYSLAGRWDQAAGALRGLVALQPANLGFRMRLFDTCLRGGHLAAARAAAWQVLVRWHGAPQLAGPLAQGFVVAGRPSAALGLLRDARRRFPRVRPLGYLEYQVLSSTGQAQAAMVVMRDLYRSDRNDPMVRHELAADAYHHGRWSEVIDYLGPLVKRKTITQPAVAALAWSYEQAGRYAEAANLFQVLAEGANDPLKMLNVGRQYEKGGDYPTAVAIYRRLVKTYPKHVPSWLALGRALGNGGDVATAGDVFQQVLQLDPQNALALRSLGIAQLSQGQRDLAEATFARLAKVDPKNTAAVGQLGDLQVQRRAADEAVATWLAGLQRRPQSALLHRRLAEAYGLDGDYDAAMAQWRAATEQEANDWLTRLQAAEMARQAGRFAEARSYYRELLDRRPDLSYAAREWLATFDAEGAPQIAVESGLQLLSLGPRQDGLAEAVLEQATRTGQLALLTQRLDYLVHRPSPQALLRDLYGQVLRAQGRRGEAADWYRQQRGAEPRDARWQRRLGEGYEVDQQLEQAVAAYEQACGLAPRQAANLAALARAEARQGQFDQAQQTLRRQLAAEPHNARGLEQLVHVYQQQGRAAQIRDLLRAVLEQPAQPQGVPQATNDALWTAYGLACELSDAPFEAAKAYRQAISLNPFQASARQRLARLVNRRSTVKVGLDSLSSAAVGQPASR